MLPPVRCKCGMPIAAYADAYEYMRNKRISDELKKNNMNVDPRFVNISSDIHPKMKDVLDELCPAMPKCCRQTYLTYINFHDHY